MIDYIVHGVPSNSPSQPSMVLDIDSGALYYCNPKGAPGWQPASALVQRVVVDLTPSQIEHLVGTPVQLLPSPGAGKFYAPVSLTMSFAFGTVPYGNFAGTSDFQIVVSTAAMVGGAPLILVNSLIDFAASSSAGNALAVGWGSNYAGSLASKVTDQPLVVYMTNGALGELTNGDGTLRVSLLYTVETVQS